MSLVAGESLMEGLAMRIEDERGGRGYPAALEGHVWLCEDPRPAGGNFGEIVDTQPEDVALFETECVCRFGCVWTRCRLVAPTWLGLGCQLAAENW